MRPASKGRHDQLVTFEERLDGSTFLMRKIIDLTMSLVGDLWDLLWRRTAAGPNG
jgi:hypothetical protein